MTEAQAFEKWWETNEENLFMSSPDVRWDMFIARSAWLAARETSAVSIPEAEMSKYKISGIADKDFIYDEEVNIAEVWLLSPCLELIRAANRAEPADLKKLHASAAEIIAAVKGQKSSRFSRIRNHARFILEKTKV